jgi:sterol desaturase/sphingolipid hydroxylase (fatty acid hydroxylase superfamily)
MVNELVQSTVVSGPGGDPEVQRGTIARMFESRFLEFFSRVHPIFPGLIFIPVMAWMIWTASALITPLAVAGCFLAGLALWGSQEYILHRFVFHFPRRGPISEWLHFYTHGIHHLYPDDKWRLVMVPPIAIPLSSSYFLAFLLLLGPGIAHAAFAGFTLGYLGYDYGHYAAHHVPPPKHPLLKPIAIIMKSQRKRHLTHHFGDSNRGFGVSMGLWDRVFGTVNPEAP